MPPTEGHASLHRHDEDNMREPFEIVFLALLTFAIVLICLVSAGCLVKARSAFANWDALPQSRRWILRVQSVGLALFLFGLLNIAVFAALGLVIGGSALHGKIEKGRYFVADHGRFTEVSPAMWFFSYYHTKSIDVTHTLGMLSGLVWLGSSRLCGEKVAGPSAPKGIWTQEAGSGSV